MSDEEPVKVLRNAIQAFRAWAEQRFPTGERYGEWECEYGNWPAIEAAFDSCLDRYAPEQWTEEIVGLLLYALARDSETERLKNVLMTRRSHLITLIRLSFNSTEHEARWQLADTLGDPGITADVAEPLLERFFDDEDEYVRRRALIALGDRGSARAEPLAVRAWDTGDQYQRMAALAALRSINSAAIGRYLALALEDGRVYLVNYAASLIPPSGRS